MLLCRIRQCCIVTLLYRNLDAVITESVTLYRELNTVVLFQVIFHPNLVARIVCRTRFLLRRMWPAAFPIAQECREISAT